MYYQHPKCKHATGQASHQARPQTLHCRFEGIFKYVCKSLTWPTQASCRDCLAQTELRSTGRSDAERDVRDVVVG